jgi:hypothetical protein
MITTWQRNASSGWNGNIKSALNKWVYVEFCWNLGRPFCVSPVTAVVEHSPQLTTILHLVA